jgi:hypothetical protein
MKVAAAAAAAPAYPAAAYLAAMAAKWTDALIYRQPKRFLFQSWAGLAGLGRTAADSQLSATRFKVLMDVREGD